MIGGAKMGWRTSRRFPGRYCKPGGIHRVVIGVGGNVGDTAARFDRMVDYLRKNGRIRVLGTSPLLKNPPFGYLDQPDFLNGVMVAETRLDPLALLRYMLWVEKRFGRRRSFKNAPRTLDLDIIFYDDIRFSSRRLRLPHPHYHERDSVMLPLAFVKDLLI